MSATKFYNFMTFINYSPVFKILSLTHTGYAFAVDSRFYIHSNLHRELCKTNA